MASRLSVYWSPSHRRAEDYEYFAALRPTVMKLMDAGDNDYEWVRNSLPDSLVIARDWALSEQHDDMLRDPVGTGKRHADEWSVHANRLGLDRTRTIILGINEPKVWDAGVSEALRQYTIAMCERASIYNLRVGALNFSVGWPANNGPDTPPDWSPFWGVDEAIRKNNGVLAVHEYWADMGPSENWGWWAGRALRCPWSVPIVIGECGIDMYVKDGGIPMNSRGWRTHVPADRYARELAEYTARMSVDSRFVGACVYMTDFFDRTWWSFDTFDARNEILAAAPPITAASTPTPPPPTDEQGPSTPPLWGANEIEGLPIMIWPVHGIITQQFGENPQDYAKFEIPGHNGVDIGCFTGTPVKAITDGEVMFVGEDIAYGKYVRIWHPGIRSHSLVAHMSETSCAVGQVVKRGDAIGESGNTGNSSGPHLHLELRAGTRDTYTDITAGHGKGRYDPMVAYWLTGSPIQPNSGQVR